MNVFLVGDILELRGSLVKSGQLLSRSLSSAKVLNQGDYASQWSSGNGWR